MGAIVSEGQLKTITQYVDDARLEGAHVFQPDAKVPSVGLYFPPTLITNVQTVSKCVSEEVRVVTFLTLSLLMISWLKLKCY